MMVSDTPILISRYVHYCQMRKGDAREKGLVCMKMDFSAMCDQSDHQRNCNSFEVILLSPSRDKVFQIN